jgi:hypothetical protein
MGEKQRQIRRDAEAFGPGDESDPVWRAIGKTMPEVLKHLAAERDRYIQESTIEDLKQ